MAIHLNKFVIVTYTGIQHQNLDKNISQYLK